MSENAVRVSNSPNNAESETIQAPVDSACVVIHSISSSEIKEVDRPVDLSAGTSILPETQGDCYPLDVHTPINKIMLQIGMTNRDKSIPPKRSHGCIHKVPVHFRATGPERYTPRVVSIGPYHHGNADLIVKDGQKKKYMMDLLDRQSAAEGVIQDIVRNMANDVLTDVENIRQCYSEEITLTNEELVALLVVDGCFLLGLFYKYLEGKGSTMAGEFLFSTNWTMPSLRRDLVLLENQIPFSVMVTLYKHAPKLLKDPLLDFYTLNEVIGNFFYPILPAPTHEYPEIASTVEGKHVLDLLRSYLICQFQIPLRKGKGKTLTSHTTSVTNLEEAGIKFKKTKNATCLLNITFVNGNFEIPPFFMGGETWKTLFSNMIALEQCDADYSKHITSYVRLIDNLIESGKDVQRLKKKGIIFKSLMEDNEVADMVNSLCKPATDEKFCYDGLCADVNEYSQNWFNKWSGSLRRNCIGIPWKGLSMGGVVLILFLTFIQTGFTVGQWIRDTEKGS
ncbi:hypothetical protein ACHQM5_004298 [Ranunculus cassubicifolius]